MSLDPSYLEYKNRRYGMDHDLYEWSMLKDRPPIDWSKGGAPAGTRIALLVVVGLQWFPLNPTGKPFKAPGSMQTAYPDLRHYTLRDYGNRVGIYRFFELFDSLGIKPTMAINSDLVDRIPYLMRRVRERGDEVIGHSRNMDALLHGELPREEEQALIAESLDKLSDFFGTRPRGWLSPARSESGNTLELLEAAGVAYSCDWVNDDMPYRFTVGGGGLHAMPLSWELTDNMIVFENLHGEQSYLEQVIDAFDFLDKEARGEGTGPKGGRLLALNIHPWVMGQPHRIGKLEQALSYILGRGGVWSATGSDILAAWQANQG